MEPDVSEEEFEKASRGKKTKRSGLTVRLVGRRLVSAQDALHVLEAAQLGLPVVSVGRMGGHTGHRRVTGMNRAGKGAAQSTLNCFTATVCCVTSSPHVMMLALHCFIWWYVYGTKILCNK